MDHGVITNMTKVLEYWKNWIRLEKSADRRNSWQTRGNC